MSYPDATNLVLRHRRIECHPVHWMQGEGLTGAEIRFWVTPMASRGMSYAKSLSFGRGIPFRVPPPTLSPLLRTASISSRTMSSPVGSPAVSHGLSNNAPNQEKRRRRWCAGGSDDTPSMSPTSGCSDGLAVIPLPAARTARDHVLKRVRSDDGRTRAILTASRSRCRKWR